MKKSKINFRINHIRIIIFHGNRAQEKTPTFGLKGLNFSNLYTDTVDDNNVLTGLMRVLYAKFPITNNISNST
jgi:hypothetical protein